MPWQRARPIKLRMRFVNAVLADGDSMTALCDEYLVKPSNPVAGSTFGNSSYPNSQEALMKK
jgi:hypothetical protein